MKSKLPARKWFVTAFLAFAAAASGCIADPTSVTFVAGYLLGSLTSSAATQETCYLNGALVDCSTVNP